VSTIGQQLGRGSQTASHEEATIGVEDDVTDKRSAALPEVGRGTEIGRYVLVGEIGRGATSVVHAAYDTDLDRRVALKLLATPIGADEDRRRKLLREAQSMAKIRHPNVLAVHDVGTWRDRLYVAMEFVEGTTLGKWCRAPGRTTAEILGAYEQAARGLAAAHAAAVIHRDFKPDNALVDAEGSVRVADFGLALADQAAQATTRRPRPLGTPAYMSPEHYAGTSIDARSDQFSFCVSLFEALWGERPFRGDTLAALAAATIEARIQVVPSGRVSRRVRDVVLRGLAARPEDRHASMDALVTALERAQRSRWPLPVAGLASIAAISTAWMFLLPDSPPSTSGCVPGAERVAAVWNDERRAAIVLVDPELEPAYLRRSENWLRSRLDAYAGAWASTYDSLCPTILHTADDAIANARGGCLEERLAALDGFVGFVSTRDVSPVRVGPLLTSLPSVDACSSRNVVTLDPVPADPARAAEIGELRARIRDITLIGLWAATEAALEEADAIVVRARELAEPHLLATALIRRGILEHMLGRTNVVSRTFDEALVTAVAAGHDALAARSIAAHVTRRPTLSHADPELDRLLVLGEAFVERIGGDELLRGELLLARGIVRSRSDDTSAVDVLLEAERAFRAAGEGHDERVVSARLAAAIVQTRLRRYDDARASVAIANELYRTTLVGDSTGELRTLHILALIEQDTGNREAADAAMTRSVELSAEIFGQRGRTLSSVLYNFALLELEQGELEQARDLLDRSLRAWPVPDDPTAQAEFEYAEGVLAQANEDIPGALAHIDRALAIYETIPEVAGTTRAQPMNVRSELMFARGDYRESLADATRTWPLLGGSGIDVALRRNLALRAVAASLALRDDANALLWLARAEMEPPALPLESVTLRLTRALFGTPDDPALAQAIRDDYAITVRLSSEREVLAREIDLWLRGRHPATTRDR
jgi:serine/threonine protein kinase/tetratricopeptide (TPR) repeat protein